MLQPANRLTLLDAMRPPTGMGLEAAIAVTYTLDLRALLAAPAAFALAARPATDSDEGDEPLPAVELLHAIRQHAGRLTVFAQAGQIALPPSRRIFAFLDQTLVTVTAPAGGVVHPKAWVLRYRHTDTGARRVRALIASRNLTFDPSWDLILRLDEAPDGRGRLDGLADLFDGLADRAAPAESHRHRVAALSAELRATTFALPAGVDELDMLPLGLGGDAAPAEVLPARADRSLIISPFLDNRFFSETHLAPVQTLISRADELQALSEKARTNIEQPMTFDDGSDDEAADEKLSLDDPRRALSGLHAKLFAFETDGRAELYVGSANATSAAFGRNVEILVRLRGHRDQLGIDRLLYGTDDEPGLEKLLRTWQPEPDAGGGKEDPHRRLDRARLTLGALTFTGHAEMAGDGTWTATYRTHEPLPDLPELTVECWPVTQPASRRRLPTGQPLDEAFPATVEQLSRLLAVEVTDSEGHTSAFVVPVDVQGIPDARDAALLRDLLGNTERFLRYLLALLDGGADDSDLLDRLEPDDPAGDSSDGDAVGGAFSVPVLERLLTQLRCDPKRLDHIDPLIRDLHHADALPDGFAELWDALRDAAARATT